MTDCNELCAELFDMQSQVIDQESVVEDAQNNLTAQQTTLANLQAALAGLQAQADEDCGGCDSSSSSSSSSSSTTPTGACCLSGTCYDGYTESNCISLGGVYAGDGTACVDNPCSSSSSSSG